MSVNFEHMKPWGDIYRSCEELENKLADETKDGLIKAIASERDVLDGMVLELMKHAGITRAQRNEVVRHLGKGSGSDTYGDVLALEYYGVIDSKSSANYHEIRKTENPANHKNRSNYSERKYDVIRNDLERTYKLLYEESYLFAKQYMKQPAGKAVRHMAAEKNTPAAEAYVQPAKNVPKAAAYRQPVQPQRVTAQDYQPAKKSGLGLVGKIVGFLFIGWLIAVLLAGTAWESNNRKMMENQRQWEQESHRQWEQQVQNMQQQYEEQWQRQLRGN